MEYREVPNLISHFDAGVKRANQHSEECVHTPSRQADILSMWGDTNQQKKGEAGREGERDESQEEKQAADEKLVLSCLLVWLLGVNKADFFSLRLRYGACLWRCKSHVLFKLYMDYLKWTEINVLETFPDFLLL